jgi:1-deoxy-D-xylulose-5-phosphate reductoisomerase
MTDPRVITLLGATGSIGRQTLEVAAAHPERFRVGGISGRSNVDLLCAQWQQFRPAYVAIGDESRAAELRSRLPKETKVLAGAAGLCELATLPEADIVLAAISGSAGLASIFAAVKAGKRVAIANKEPLVAAGELLTAEAVRSGATLFPVDSEHSALFQLLQGREGKEVARLILTGSGGPFREAPADLAGVTPEQALAHPTWKMGPKVTVDSATLMNKGLEIIEAHWLFGRPLGEIDVVIHPQSIIHAMIEFSDGALLAHLSAPDMRLPIQFALGFPERLPAAWARLDLLKAGRLDFLPPDLGRFPCLRLAREAGEIGGTAPAVMNAANEAAVGQFLEGKLKFTDIPRIVEKALQAHKPIPHPDLEAILQAEEETKKRLQVN